MHHIEIYVSDLKKTKEFYNLFINDINYSFGKEWDNGFIIENKDNYIVFVQVKEKYKKYIYDRKHIGLNHICFKVNSKKIIDKIRNTLRNNNVKLLYDDKYPHAGGINCYSLYFEDTDGMKLEIVFSK